MSGLFFFSAAMLMPVRRLMVERLSKHKTRCAGSPRVPDILYFLPRVKTRRGTRGSSSRMSSKVGVRARATTPIDGALRRTEASA